jgi:prepilin-type N-terminal cleavage/methylation domain-containing protein/prepilin-type processing-associated H-X9-DG protein
MRQRRPAFTLVELLVVITVIGILLALILPAVQAAREASRRTQCAQNLKQIGLGLANYEASHSVLPFGVGGGSPPGWFPRWSAQSQILPFVEQTPLYNQLNFYFLPWAHDPVYPKENQTALSIHITVFLCPSDVDNIDERYGLAHNNYRGNAGSLPYNLAADSPDGKGRNNGVFWYQSAVRMTDVTDGSSRTAAFSERCLGNSARLDALSDFYLVGTNVQECSAVVHGVTPRYDNYPYGLEWSGQRWGDGNLFYTRYSHVLTPGSPSCLLGGYADNSGQAVVSATSRHPGGVNLLTLDGSVRFVKTSVDQRIWSALGTANGNEASSSDF